MAARANGFKYSGHGAGNDPAWRVVIPLRPSRVAGAWVAAVAALGLLALFASAVPAPAKGGAGVLLAVIALAAVRRHALAVPHRVVRLATDLAGTLELERADGTRESGQVLAGSFVAPFLTLVRWRPAGARLARTLLVAPDSAPAADLRRLRVLLRWR